MAGETNASATALAFLNSLRPAVPFSMERPCTLMGNAELKRVLMQGAVLINGERMSPLEPVDFPVFSVVFFPRSKRRTTLV